MKATPQAWPEWNQRHLWRALVELRTRLARSLDAEPAPAEVPVPSEEREAHEQGEAAEDAALERLCRAFRLTPFERGVLLLCAGAELDARFAELLARANGAPERRQPTFSLALALFPGAHWSALTPARPLRRWGLVELRPGTSLVESALALDERVLHHLCGVDVADERLRGALRALEPAGPLAGPGEALARTLAAAWKDAARPRPVALVGDSGADLRSIAGRAAGELGLGAVRLSAADVPAPSAERASLARLLEREAILARQVLVLDAFGAEPAEVARAHAFLAELEAWSVLVARRTLAEVEPGFLFLEAPLASRAEQAELWRAALGPERATGLNGEIEAVAQQFRLDGAAIRAVAGALDAPVASPRSLWRACRSRARGPLEELAQRLEARARWDDLVLPEEPLRALRGIAAHVRQRKRVHEDWGFAASSARGRGITALFSGPSGVGKTLAAEVLACELDLDLFRIDLAAVVSKYVGETEKNLRRIFDAAETSGAILLFDEADALFGRRSEVKDSHDRYANIEVSYLLQRMESYAGLAILTTNQRQAIDPAFARRLRFLVSFPFPDAAHRARIWSRAFPAAAPTEGLEPARLARLSLSGGHIQSIALGAAVLAADEGQPVRMAHMARAARFEFAKLERPPNEAELAAWS